MPTRTMIDRTVLRSHHFRANRPGEVRITPRWGHPEGHLITRTPGPELLPVSPAKVSGSQRDFGGAA